VDTVLYMSCSSFTILHASCIFTCLFAIDRTYLYFKLPAFYSIHVFYHFVCLVHFISVQCKHFPGRHSKLILYMSITVHITLSAFLYIQTIVTFSDHQVTIQHTFVQINYTEVCSKTILYFCSLLIYSVFIVLLYLYL